jgi:uncharacterized protein
MKLFFISDIHGSLFYLEKVLKHFEKDKFDFIINLGDSLYHGPRNPLPKDYNPSQVAEILNKYKNKMLAVRGNCDSEVDQMLIKFPMMSDYSIILYEKKRLFLTHGHIFNANNLPELSVGDVLIHGHSHIPTAEKIDNIYIFNPGSVSLPKENNPNSFGILENNAFFIKDFNGNTLKQINI